MGERETGNSGKIGGGREKGLEERKKRESRDIDVKKGQEKRKERLERKYELGEGLMIG